jgi:hypothetical protein
MSIGGELGKDWDGLLSVIRSVHPPEKESLGFLAIGLGLNDPRLPLVQP